MITCLATWAKLWKIALFKAWAVTVSSSRLSVAREEVNILRSKLGSMASSIWHMNKMQLVKVAEAELKITEENAKKFRVGELQEMIKEHRDLLKTPQQNAEGSLKGITTKRHQELVQMAQGMGINVVDPISGKVNKRETMIRHIKAKAKEQYGEEMDMDDDEFRMINTPPRSPDHPAGCAGNSAVSSAPVAQPTLPQLDMSKMDERTRAAIAEIQSRPDLQHVLQAAPELLLQPGAA